jgi:diaminopimelate epimerase
MLVHFSKYHGTGNDFVIIDGRELELPVLDQSLIHRLCHRRFGIGADGLIVLEPSEAHDFYMRYFNADGKEGSMCGNGGRCIVAFANQLGIAGTETSFEGIDGIHFAAILSSGDIRLKLSDVSGIHTLEDGYLLDTGSPHFVKFVENLDQIVMELEGKEIRHQDRFGEQGVNVNFVETVKGTDTLFVRTFERGVEAETWSCGTGVTAAAIGSYFHHKSDKTTCHIRTKGGNLQVDFQAKPNLCFTDVYLTGPASHVYDGTIQTGD